MAFQIKKDLHLDIGIYLELLDDLTNAQVKTDNYDNTKYIVPIKHIGNDITEGGGLKWFHDKKTSEWVILKDGKTTDMEISEALYKQLVKYDKGSKVQVMMKDIDGKMGKFTGYDVKPLNGVASEGSSEVTNDKPKTVDVPNKVLYSNDDRDMQIKWGMCLKEATKLSIAICTDEEEPNYLQTIEHFTFKLMDIAVDGFKKWENEHHQKDQNSTIDDLF